MNDFVWTDARVEELTRRWADGQSAGQIAAVMGAQSRSAVIGKVHRLNLSALPRHVRVRLSGEPMDKRERNRAPAPNRPARPPRPYVPKSVPLTEPASRDLRLTDLTERLCKYPHGDAVPYRFCGAKADGASVYCSYHSRLAYTQSEPRGRRA